RGGTSGTTPTPRRGMEPQGITRRIQISNATRQLTDLERALTGRFDRGLCTKHPHRTESPRWHTRLPPRNVSASASATPKATTSPQAPAPWGRTAAPSAARCAATPSPTPTPPPPPHPHPPRPRPAERPDTTAYVRRGLAPYGSPAQSAGRRRPEFPHAPRRPVAHPTISAWIARNA